ncbi:hypothetical protein AAMO2058_000948000 [Amorphochlora amoebiformis]
MNDSWITRNKLKSSLTNNISRIYMRRPVMGYIDPLSGSIYCPIHWSAEGQTAEEISVLSDAKASMGVEDVKKRLQRYSLRISVYLHRSKSLIPSRRATILVGVVLLVLLMTLAKRPDFAVERKEREAQQRPTLPVAERSAEESNRFILTNVNFFLDHAVTFSSSLNPTYRVTLNGNAVDAHRAVQRHNARADSRKRPKVHILQRQNSGYDFGAHFAMLKAEAIRLGVGSPLNLPYDTYIFLNDGVRGPFVPSYMPKSWHWAEGFLSRLSGPVQLVGTSVVCLADDDLSVVKFGMKGPKVETFAFAITAPALRYDLEHGTSFAYTHETKFDAIVRGEYNLSYNILNSPHSWSISSLLLQHENIDFRDPKNWACNSQMHPSRNGTYAGISISPFEVIFHKSWWRTLNPHPDVSAREMQVYTDFINQNSKNAIYYKS